jgi:uncharacterized protein YndB with AHSA1/START domain
MKTQAFVVQREIRIEAPREHVFALLSSREGPALWMPFTILEPRVGGNVQIRFVPDTGDEAIVFGKITAYEPPSRIAFTWDFKDDPLDAVTEVTIDLVSEEEATFVRLTHAGFVDEQEQGKHAEGWVYWLERLKALAEGNDPGSDRSIEGLRQFDERER